MPNPRIDCAVGQEYYDASAAGQYTQHRSVRENRGLDDQALTLERCIDTFTREEDISEAYCSKAKEPRDAKLRVCFWRLPPVLVIHLKVCSRRITRSAPNT